MRYIIETENWIEKENIQFSKFYHTFCKKSRENEKEIKGVDLLSNKQQKSVEEIAREERLAYFREWRSNNKDKVKKHNATYWEKRAKRIIAEREAKQNEAK